METKSHQLFSGTNLSIECLILCIYFYFFAIFLSGEIGSRKTYLPTTNFATFQQPWTEKGWIGFMSVLLKKFPIFRGFRLLVSVSTKEESSLKVIIFAMSVGKNQSRFEWQPIRQYVVFWILNWIDFWSWVYNVILWTRKFPGLIFP